MTEWDGRPQNPERDGWHWLMRDTLLYPARWDAAASAWHLSRFLTPHEIAQLNDYCGPCLTPAEVEARVAEAATACSAAWKAAPEGEGVMGAEYFAELAASKVLQTGKSAVEVCNEMFAGVGTYGSPFKHVLLTKGEIEARVAAARRAALEEAASIADGRPSDRGEDVAAAIRALLTEGER